MPDTTSSLWSAMLRRDVLLRGVKFAVVVGTLLVVINHYDALLRGTLEPARVGKILLTYCVPFGVTVLSSAQAILANERRGD